VSVDPGMIIHMRLIVAPRPSMIYCTWILRGLSQHSVWRWSIADTARNLRLPFKAGKFWPLERLLAFQDFMELETGELHPTDWCIGSIFFSGGKKMSSIVEFHIYICILLCTHESNSESIFFIHSGVRLSLLVLRPLLTYFTSPRW
jgi:hypothetical protein